MVPTYTFPLSLLLSNPESIALKVDDTSDVYFVPAFSGLFAPYWQSDARGSVVKGTPHPPFSCPSFSFSPSYPLSLQPTLSPSHTPTLPV